MTVAIWLEQLYPMVLFNIYKFIISFNLAIRNPFTPIYSYKNMVTEVDQYYNIFEINVNI